MNMRNMLSIVAAVVLAVPMLASAVIVGHYDSTFEGDTVGLYPTTASYNPSAVNTAPRDNPPLSTDTVLVQDGHAGLLGNVAVLTNVDLSPTHGSPVLQYGAGGDHPFRESTRFEWDMSISPNTDAAEGHRFFFVRLQDGGSLIQAMGFRKDAHDGEDGDIVCHFCGGDFESSLFSPNAGWNFNDPMHIAVDINRTTGFTTWTLANSLGTRVIGQGVEPGIIPVNVVMMRDGGNGIVSNINTFEVGIDNFQSIPEPASLALLALGAVAIRLVRRSRS